VEDASRLPSGIRDRTTLAGDITNPILTTESAQTVRRFGELSRRGSAFPSPITNAGRKVRPFIYRVLETQILQTRHEVLILYSFDHQVRRIRLNPSHPAREKPSWSVSASGLFSDQPQTCPSVVDVVVSLDQEKPSLSCIVVPT
jgi:hypothetical protein